MSGEDLEIEGVGVIRKGRRSRFGGWKGEQTGTWQVNLPHGTGDGMEALVEGRVGTSTRNWLTDVKKKKKKVPHDPHPVAPQLRRA